VACGHGRIAELFSPENYLGIDYSDELIKLAKELHPKYNFAVADGKSFTPDRKYDIIIEVISLGMMNITPREFYDKYKDCANKYVICINGSDTTIFFVKPLV